MSRPPASAALRVASIVVVALALAGAVGVGAAYGAGYPPLPIADDRGFLGNLSAPTVVPGSSGTIDFSVGDPLPAPISDAVLTLQIYAFNGFPGNATATITVVGAPVLSNTTSSGGSVGVAIGALAHGEVVPGSIGVTTSASTPNGAFAVRTALAFESNGTSYLLDSRGWFNASTWAAATELPNGSATLNLTVLGVSGVIPETAIVVSSSSFPWVLGGVLVAAAIFVGAGAYVYFRGPSSRSGVGKDGSDDHHAPSAFGKRRTRDGD